MLKALSVRFLEFAYPEEENAKVSLIAIPWNGLKVSRYGAKLAPSYIRAYSELIESVSELTGYDLAEGGWEDLGDLEVLPHWSSEEMAQAVSEMLMRILAGLEGKIPLFIGGDHSVTLPILRALKRLGMEPVILHLDAHLDLHEHFEGDRYSYACVMRRVIEELGLRVIQYGVRTRIKEEELFRRSCQLHNQARDLNSLIDELSKLSGDLYISLDLDVLDPSIMRGVTNPVSGGMNYGELLDILRTLFSIKNLRVVGADVVELNPIYDLSGYSSALAAEILRELIALLITH